MFAHIVLHFLNLNQDFSTRTRLCLEFPNESDLFNFSSAADHNLLHNSSACFVAEHFRKSSFKQDTDMTKPDSNLCRILYKTLLGG